MQRLHMVGVIPDFGCNRGLWLQSRTLAVMPDIGCHAGLWLSSRTLAVIPYFGCHPGLDPWMSSRARPLDVMPDPIRHPWIAGAATPDLIGGFIDSRGRPQ